MNEELLHAVDEVIECLMLENMTRSNFTFERIKRLAEVRDKLEKEPKYHWYNYCFRSDSHYVNKVFGYKTEGITVYKINEAKQDARIKDNCVLISCSYLGYMNEEEFNGE